MNLGSRPTQLKQARGAELIKELSFSAAIPGLGPHIWPVLSAPPQSRELSVSLWVFAVFEKIDFPSAMS